MRSVSVFSVVLLVRCKKLTTFNILSNEHMEVGGNIRFDYFTNVRRKCGFQGRGVFSEASGPSSFEFGLAEFTSGTAASLLLSFRDIPLSVLLWLSAIQ